MYAPGYGGYIPTPEDIRRDVGRLKSVQPTTEGVACEHHHLTGDAAAEIVRFAKENQIDLVVMGTHGRRGVTRLLMGSVAEAVVRQAPCPVMTIKQPVEEVQKLV
jgi:nucleotide-binding universal stress UspA family protein